MALPSNVSFCFVRGRFIRAILDGYDIGRDPDGVPVEGLSVTFTAALSDPKVRNASATPPVTIIIDPIVATTDADGVLIGPDGEPGVYLVASDDPDLQPTGWSYTVTIQGPSVARSSFAFNAPVGGDIDLATVIPVPASPGTEVVAWQSAVDVTLAARDEVVAIKQGEAPLFPVVKYGTVDPTGVTDSSTAINAAIAAAYAAGGGTVLFPTGHLVWGTSPTLPHGPAVGSAYHDPAIAYQPTIKLVGSGAVRGSLWGTGLQVKPVHSETVLEMRGTTGPAQLDTRGTGTLVIEGVTFYDPNAVAPIPFIQTTNTALLVNNVSFFGSPDVEGQACTKDAIVFGGTDAPATGLADSTSSSFFQGYGTHVQNVFFSHVRTGLWYRSAANNIIVTNPVFAISCGADATRGAIVMAGGTLDGIGNVVVNAIIEMSHYVYGVVLKPNGSNLFINPGFYDSQAQVLGAFRLIGGSNRNTAIGGFYSMADTMYVSSDGNAANRINLQYGSGFFQKMTASAGFAVTNDLTANKVIVTGSGLNQFVLLDDTPVDSSIIMQIGNTGKGMWRVTNAGAGTTRRTLNGFDASNVQRISFDPNSQIVLSAINIATDTTTGTKIGTATTQKLGFYNATPIVQPSATPAAATDLATAITLVNNLRTKLIALGLIA